MIEDIKIYSINLVELKCILTKSIVENTDVTSLNINLKVCLKNIFLKNEEQIKTFQSKQKLKKIVASRLDLQNHQISEKIYLYIFFSGLLGCY